MSQQAWTASVLGLHRKRTTHVDVDVFVASFFDSLGEKVEFLHVLGDDLRDDRYTLIEVGMDVSDIFATDTASFHTEEWGIVVWNSA